MGGPHEPALHNDSSIGDPPTAIHGRGLYEHVHDAAAHLGFPVYTYGRHAGGHMAAAPPRTGRVT